jgi:tetratricopeptide (TPR) repeat protein
LAITDYSNAIKFNTRDTSAFTNKSRLEFESGQYKNAIASTNHASASGIPDVWYYSALSNEKTGNFLNAGEDFWKAKQLRLDSVKVKAFRKISQDYFYKGKASFDKGIFENALADFSKSISLDTSNNALFYRGRSYWLTDKVDEAEIDFTTLIGMDPTYISAHYQRGLVRIKKDKLDLALADLTEEYDRYPKASPIEKIRLQIKMGLFDEAARDADVAAKKFRDAIAYRYAVEAYFKTGNYTKAIEVGIISDDLKKPIDTNYYYRARAYFETGDMKKAKSYLEDALKINEKYADASYWYGRILYQSEDYSDANLSFNTALSSEEFKNDATYFSGMCKIRQRLNFKTASNEISKSIDNDSKKYGNAENYSWLAYCALSEDASAANNLLDKAKEKDPQNPTYNYVLACVNAKKHDAATAFQFLEKALSAGKFKKSEVDREPYFESLKSTASKDQYKALLKKYFN